MIANYNRCPLCHALGCIILELTDMDNGADHAIVCQGCGTETQVTLKIKRTIYSDYVKADEMGLS